MSALNPNVTIKFSGEGDQAIKASDAVGAALDNLAIKSRNAKLGLQSVSLMMDNVSNKSAKVAALGQAYQSAASGIVSTLNATRASAAAFVNMGAAADAAKAKVVSLNQAGAAAPKTGRQASAKSPLTFDAPTSIGNMGPSIAGMARMAATTVGVSVGLGVVGQQVKSLITANMDLDSAMSAVAAVGNLDKMSAQYRELTDLVVKFGGETQYSAAQAAGGLKELIAGGYSAADSALLLKDTLSLAATENMELGRASEIVVAGLQSFHLAVDQSARLTNVLARGANASTASIDGMGEAFKYLAPVSSAMGVSLEDSAAAIALLANNGLQAGLAGRGMSAIMSRMIAPTKDAQAVLTKFGVSLAEINPEIAGLGGAMKTLEKIDTAGLVTLFGAENLDVSNVLKSNASAFEGLVKQMKDVSITAEGMAAKKNDNAGGDFKKLSAAIQEVRVELGQDLYASMRGYVQDFTVYLRENKEEIIGVVKYVGNLAVAIAPLVGAYVALKTVSFAGTLAAQAVAWGRETLAISANTRAVVADTMAKRANAVVMPARPMSDFSTTQRRRMSGIDNPSFGSKIKSIGATKINVRDMLPSVSETGTSMKQIFVGGVEGTGAKLSKSVGVLGQVAVAAIAGWEIGSAIEQHFQLSEKWVNWLYEGEDAANETANSLLTGSAAMLQNAKSANDLESAKKQIVLDIGKARTEMSGMDPGSEEFKTMQNTIKVLELRLKTADKIFERNKSIADEASRVAAQEALAAEEAKKLATDLQIAKVHAENLANAGEKMAEGLPDFGKLIIESLPDPEALNIFKGQEAQAVREANAARAAIEDSLTKAGVDTSLISKDRAIKDTDDVVAYARAAFALLKNNDKGGNLLGTDAAAAMKKAVEGALAAKKAAEGKSKSIDSKEDARVKTAQEISSIEADIAINRAKAAGNTAEVKRLEREKALLEEKAKIQAILTKDTVKGSPEEKAAIAKANDLAEKSVAAKEAAVNPVVTRGPAATLGSAAQGINSFFGRSANAGMIEEAKKHTELLAAIKESLAKTNKPEKTEIVVRPAFAI